MSFCKVILIFFILIPMAFASSSINANKAPFHLNESLLVCGVALEIKKLNKRVIINLDDNYPNQNITFLIWDSDLNIFNNKFGSLFLLKNKRICGFGKIEEYKGHLQIIIKKEQYLRLINE